MSSDFTSGARFNPPPGWPQPPAGYHPPATWQVDPSWPTPPPNWPFYLDAAGRPTNPPPGAWLSTPIPQPQTPPLNPNVPLVLDYQHQSAVGAPPTPKKRRLRLWLGLLTGTLILALIGAGLGWWFYYRPGPVISADPAKLFTPEMDGFSPNGSSKSGPEYIAGWSKEDACADHWGPKYAPARIVDLISGGAQPDGGGVALVQPTVRAARDMLQPANAACKAVGDKAGYSEIELKHGGPRGSWRLTQTLVQGKVANYVCSLQYGNVVAYLRFDTQVVAPSIDCGAIFNHFRNRIDDLAH